MTPTTATLNSNNNLGDYSSRNSGNGNLLKVPVEGNEYFLLASRNKYSKWDRVMGGDVAQIQPYEDDSDYGKGLYIYHIPNVLYFPSTDISIQDMECVDGLFTLEYGGQSEQQVVQDCYRSPTGGWYYYNKKSVLYENDSSNLFPFAPPSGYFFRNNGDGISFRNYIGVGSNGEHKYRSKWWGEGKQPEDDCDIGTDRLSINNEEPYTRFDVGGDRYDPWKPGYNEVFSPYSSPNTNTWSTTPTNQNSGIFIYYNVYSGSGPGGVASVKIYKAGTGGYTDSSILSITPPSRPMGLRVLPCDSLPEVYGFKKIKIGWNHNREPDMRRVVEGDTIKRYKIYRSIAGSMTEVPPDALTYSETVYEYIGYKDVLVNELPSFIDTLNSICTVPDIFGEPGCHFL